MEDLTNTPIFTDSHCFGCTAGARLSRAGESNTVERVSGILQPVSFRGPCLVCLGLVGSIIRVEESVPAETLCFEFYVIRDYANANEDHSMRWIGRWILFTGAGSSCQGATA
eukprot:1179193-Prorocentrum_minimum.AAC.3